MLARGWRRGPVSVARTSWLQTSSMMFSSAVPPKTKTMKPHYPVEKQHLVLQVLQAMHDEAGRPNPFYVKARLDVPFDDKYPPELHGKRLEVSKLRMDKREGQLDAEVEAILNAMGFMWDFDEYQWNENKRALVKYKALHGNLLVPSDYKVPSDDPRWPQELWTKKLGNVVSILRQSKAQLAAEDKQWLDAMGFVWDGNEAHWQSNLKALQTYKAIHGHLLVPTACVVPSDDPQWPKDYWGLKLGHVVSWLRRGAHSLPPQKREVLDAMGFVWRVTERGDGNGRPASISIQKQRDFVQVVQAQLSQQVHTEFVILPKRFVVPDEDPWPRHLHQSAYDVSLVRRAFREGRLDPSVVEELDAMGFVWNDKEHQWNLNMEALTIFKTLHQDLLVRRNFTIPHDDPAWPVYLWGKKLGHVVHHLRQPTKNLTFAEEDQLDSMGFVWDAQEAHWQLNYKGLQTFKDLHGHVNIPQDFIVPKEDPAWPFKLWNVQLGKFVCRLRTYASTVSKNRRQALDALGFEWNMLETQWERNLLALETFQAIHGHLLIPRSFVVPEDDPLWPRDLWTMKLGYAANNIRQSSQQEGYPASRLDQLTKIGFLPAK